MLPSKLFNRNIELIVLFSQIFSDSRFFLPFPQNPPLLLSHLDRPHFILANERFRRPSIPICFRTFLLLLLSPLFQTVLFLLQQTQSCLIPPLHSISLHCLLHPLLARLLFCCLRLHLSSQTSAREWTSQLRIAALHS